MLSNCKYRQNRPQHRKIKRDLRLFSEDVKRQDVAIIKAKDWHRMRNVSNFQLEAEKHEWQWKEREALFELSQNRVKQWDNTIEGQRLKKLQARKIKMEQDEAERQIIDIEEAKLQAKNRKEAIESAKRLQYMQTDRVKGFHAALTLTEVLKERDAQVDMKIAKRDWEKHKEDELVAQQKQNYEDSLREERDKAKVKFHQAFDTAQFQKQQEQDRAGRKKEEMLEDIVEGRAIKEQYETYKIAKNEIEKQKTKEKIALRDSYFKEWEFKQERLKEEKLREIEIEKEIKKFVNAKRQMALLRQKKEEELFNTFQKHTQNICNKLEKEMNSKVDDEDERIAKAVYEQEMKRVREEEEKAQAELEGIKETNVQRLRMIKDHQNERKENMLRDKAFLEERMKNDKSFKESVEIAKSKRRADAVAIQDFYKQQSASKNQKIKDEIAKQLEADVQNTQILEKEEEMFQLYADKVIEDAKSQKRTLFPLLKARTEGPGGGRGPKFQGNAGLRPSYIVEDATGVQLPHYMKDEAMKEKVYGHVGRTGNRMGFNW